MDQLIHALAAQTDIQTVGDISAAWATGVGAGIGALLVVITRTLRGLSISRLLPSPWRGILAASLSGLASVGAVLAAGGDIGAVLSAAVTGLVVPIASLLTRADED